MRFGDSLVTVIAMDDELRLPLVRRVMARFSERHWVALDVVVALLIGVSAIFTASNATFRVSGTTWDVVRYAAAAVAAAALPLRRRYPLGALTVILPAVAVAVGLQVEQSLVYLSALALYTVSAVSPRRTSQIALGVVLVAMWSAVTAANESRLGGGLFVTGVGILAAWLAGENTRSRMVYATAVSERAAEREVEREQRMQRAVADERVVIARELHDIVAHAMSVIAVRAGVARVVIDAQPDEAREALGIIETTARRALQEMRLLVGVLRRTDGVGDGELIPAPGLDRVVELVDQARHAGVEVAVEIDGDERPLPGGADLSAYRIIQEALTNVARHAGPTRARLRIVYRTDEIVIEVVDEGGRNWDQPHPDPAGSGHGLIGMRERAALYGGELVAGPHGHGFEVRATLPIEEGSG
jgi:signal transduction histidine kinase